MGGTLIKEFVLPEHLQNRSATEIHKEMLEMLPDKLDKSEGQFPHDFTWPTAVENAELYQFTFPMQLKSIFPMWAVGSDLDLCGDVRGIARKSATAAKGKVTVTAKAGTVIQAGDLFSTASEHGEESINFSADEAVYFETAGTKVISVTAVVTGTKGNVAAESITLKVTRNNGIQSLMNAEATKGGTDIESDDSYRIRLVEHDQSQGEHFTGNVGDYKRWAESVDGTGTAKVLQAVDDSGTVRIVLMDGNGEPANADLCQSVYDYIMRPDSPLERRAPPDVILVVLPPEVIPVVITGRVELEDDVSLETVLTDFAEAMREYLKETDREVIFTKVCALLSNTNGVADYSGILMNGSTENITLEETQMAIAGESELTV